MPLANSSNSQRSSTSDRVIAACAAGLLAVGLVMPFAPWIDDNDIQALALSDEVVMVQDVGH